MRNRGDEVLSESPICMGLPPTDGSSFEFLLAQSHSFLRPLRLFSS